MSSMCVMSQEQEGSIGQLIREKRELSRMSSKELANAAGVSPAAISRIENGYLMPRIDTLARISRALGCSLTISIN